MFPMQGGMFPMQGGMMPMMGGMMPMMGGMMPAGGIPGQNCLGFNQFNGGLGAMGSTMDQGLILLIQQVVAPGEWAPRCNNLQYNPMFPGGQVPGAAIGNPGGAAPPGGNPLYAQQLQNTNTIGFYAPALALVVRGTSHVHSKYGGVLGGKQDREKPAMEEAMLRPGMQKIGGKDQIAGNKEKGGKEVAKTPDGKEVPPGGSPELDARKIWQDALANGLENPGLIIATTDFLSDLGMYTDVAEFLKANLRQGIIVRPWVYEALALALEASNADSDEIRRVRVSGVALDPQNAQGFLKAAQAMGESKRYDRALAFCRQAAELQPNSPNPYANALVYADLGKDSQGMEWAASNLLSQEWASDSHALQLQAQFKLDALARTLEKDHRKTEADKLRATLQKLRQRDLVINLTWEPGSSGPAGMDLSVKESGGTVCSSEHRTSPGGGTLTGATLAQLNKVSYVAAQAFSGEYEIKVRRLWGQPLGGKARLEIVQHQGTDRAVTQIETLMVDQPVVTLKIKLDGGRRTSVAVVPPPALKTEAKEDPVRTVSAIEKLQNVADPYYGGSLRGLGGSVGRPTALTRDQAFPSDKKSDKKADNVLFQTGITNQGGPGLNLNAQVVNVPGQGPGVTVTPVWQRGAFIPRNGSTMPGIPGAGN
jgi:tetratricopeptide (TPR) repeat protein